MRELMDGVLGNPDRDPCHLIAGKLLVDVRDLMKLRDEARFFVRDFELENLAAGELALADHFDEVLDSAPRQCGDRDLATSRPRDHETSRPEVFFVVDINDLLLMNPELCQ